MHQGPSERTRFRLSANNSATAGSAMAGPAWRLSKLADQLEVVS